MGKLMQNTQIKHSSHPHFLQLSSTIHLHNQPSINCCGCNLQISPSENTYYTCPPCSFVLHASCAKFPDLITHPSHRQHALSLLPTSIYPGGFFRCDACTQQGSRFSYHCQVCDFDLHALCASKPLSVTHPFHPHPLVLTFTSPYGEKVGFSCDVCRSTGSSDQWLYRCVSCEFDVHLHCATAKPPLQHQHSYPGATTPASQPNQFVAPVAGQPIMHSMSTGHVQSSWQWQPPQTPAPGGLQGYQLPSQPPSVAPGGFQSYQSPSQPPSVAPVGAQSYQMPPQPSGSAGVDPSAGSGNGLGNVMVTGFVDGMMQQLGQNFIESLSGGGGGGGGGDGGSGGGNNNDGGNNDYQSGTTNDNYNN